MSRQVAIEALLAHLERTGGTYFVALVRALVADSEKLELRRAADRARQKPRPSREDHVSEAGSRETHVSGRGGSDPPPRSASRETHVKMGAFSRETHVSQSPHTPLSDQKDASSSDLRERGGSDLVAGASREDHVSGRENVRPLLGSREDPGYQAKLAYIKAAEERGRIFDRPGAYAPEFATVARYAAKAAKNGDHRVEDVLRIWATGYHDAKRKDYSPRWWPEWIEGRGAEALSEAPILTGDGDELDENGNPVFREVEGESPAERRKRLAEHNRKIMESCR
jgi:hypothetical protein